MFSDDEHVLISHLRLLKTKKSFTILASASTGLLIGFRLNNIFLVVFDFNWGRKVKSKGCNDSTFSVRCSSLNVFNLLLLSFSYCFPTVVLITVILRWAWPIYCVPSALFSSATINYLLSTVMNGAVVFTHRESYHWGWHCVVLDAVKLDPIKLACFLCICDSVCLYNVLEYL